MPVFRLNPEQEARRKRWDALDQLAREAGFDEMALHETEFCLMSFFEAVIEECAKIADTQSQTYSTAEGASAGSAVAKAIRNYGATLGNDSRRI